VKGWRRIFMRYTIASDSVGLAIGPVVETANDVYEALIKARQMYESGLAGISMTDRAGTKSRATSYWPA
jgi:hypothetical protein